MNEASIGQKLATRLRQRLERSSQLALDREKVILDLVPAHLEALGDARYGSPYSPVEFRKGDGSPGTTVAFSSLMLQRGIVGREFENFLSRGWGDLHFVKDLKRKWFQQGIHPFTRSRPETVRFLEEYLRSAARPLRFVGASAGGYAALYFGAHLGADVVVAIAPQVRIDPSIYATFQRGTPNDGIFDYEDPENDLRTVLGKRPVAGRAIVVYGQERGVDREQAEMLNGITNIVLRPVPSAQHSLLARNLIKSGMLAECLNLKPEQAGTAT